MRRPSDWQERAIWNLRFRLGWMILPGDHKHIAIPEDDKTCSRCASIYAELAATE